MTTHQTRGRQQSRNDSSLPDDVDGSVLQQCQTCDALAYGATRETCCEEPMGIVPDEEATVEPSFVDIIDDIFDMNETEFQICIELMEKGPMTVPEVAATVDCDPSYANRLLNHLESIEVVIEESSVLDEGGRVSKYRHAPVEEIERAWKRHLLSWTAKGLRVIDEEMVAEKENALDSAHELKAEIGRT
jgi:predicted transcriptional regulator